MTILCIIGASGSGKTTLAEAMATQAPQYNASKHDPYNYAIPTICSYTTRPMRHGEKDGREHMFVNDRAAHLLSTMRTLAYTRFGGYHYFALWEQLHLGVLGYDLMSYVIDEDGYLGLQNEVVEYQETMKAKGLPVHDILLLPIFVERDAEAIARTIDHARVARDEGREYLNLVRPQIVINNDAPSADALTEWSLDFVRALRLYLAYHRTTSHSRPVHLNTKMGIAEMIAHLNDAIVQYN